MCALLIITAEAAEDFTELSRQVTEIDLDQEVTMETSNESAKEGSLPPFPDLRVLNLAYNKVRIYEPF